MYIKYSRTRDVKEPRRGHVTDSGLDFFIPNDHDKVVIEAGKSVLVDSGIKIEIPLGHCGIFMNKSSVASKLRIVLGACVDSETLISTNKGLFSATVLTQDFVKKNKVLIESYNENDKKSSFNEFSGFSCTGEKECCFVEFDDGSTLICSEDHRLLTKNGWIEAKDLNDTIEIITI